MSEFVEFKRFNTEEEAQALADFLESKKIPYQIERQKPFIDKLIIGEAYPDDFVLRLKQEDFQTANNILNEQITQSLSNLDSDYYLFSFSDDELKDVVQHPFDWNNQDVIIAKKLLNDRGIVTTDADVQQSRDRAVAEMSKYESKTGWSLVRYYLLCFVPVAGIIAGSYLMSAKKTLPDGQRLYEFDEMTRRHGFRILIISIFVLIISIVARIDRLLMGEYN